MYIDTTTFWITTAILAVAIGVVYYLLTNKIYQNRQEIERLKAAVVEAADLIDQKFKAIRHESKMDDAKIYHSVANAFKEVGKAYMESPKDKTDPKAPQA